MQLTNLALSELGLGLDRLAEVNMNSPTLAFRIAMARRQVRPFREQLRVREIRLALSYSARKPDGTLDMPEPGVVTLSDPESFASDRAALFNEEVEVAISPDVDIQLLAEAGIQVSPMLLEQIAPLLVIG